MNGNRRESRRERRRRTKEAQRRQQEWERLRDGDRPHATFEPDTRPAPGARTTPDTPSAQTPSQATATPPGLPSSHPSGRRDRRSPAIVNAGYVAGLVAAVGGVTLAVVGGTPAVAGWRPIPLTVGLIVAVSGVAAAATSWWYGASRAVRVAGAVVTAIIAAGMFAGTADQTIVDGKVLLRGSEPDRSYRAVQSAADVLVVLQENQQLLNLPPEQARSLTGVLEAAATQADQIAAAWNPATTPAGTRTEIQDLRVQINLAAVRQADAHRAMLSYLRAPDQQLERSAVERRAASAEAVAQNGPVAVAVAAARSALITDLRNDRG